MNINEVITLDNNEEYILLYKGNINNSNYFIASLIKGGNILDKTCFFKEVKDNNEYYVEIVMDDNIKEKIIEEFNKDYSKNEED